MPQTRVMLLWHMHQPFYKDLVEDRYAMPWVRLHCLKDYYGMVAMLRDFPSVHVTFNLVPSLVSQILDYAADRAHEESYELAFKPARDITPPEIEALVGYAFQVNYEHLLCRYPRFKELFEKSTGRRKPWPERLAGLQEILDLQVLSQLVWFDELYLTGDPQISALAARGRNYNEEDKRILRKKELEIFKVTLEEYASAAARGQIEISTSPFYHPILPLLCDSQVGAESSPGLPLPRRRFRHPEDAQDQLRGAIKLHQEVFGRKPQGLWPSEGSVSEEALRIAAEEGFKWAATDEGVLGRTLHTYFHRYADGTVQDGHHLYQPRRLKLGRQAMDLFFRDHQLSDLIGFVYARMEPVAAAQDLVRRIRSVARSTGDQPAVVSIILDGENAWEYFPRNGREFLRQFYGLLVSEPGLEALTPSEILSSTQPAFLPRLTPGSWINANFNVWIGADEDNHAWDALNDARDYFSEAAGKAKLNPEQAEKARRELWIAEGSDWCWWYGPEHSTSNDEEFDVLYRKHLVNLYRLLGGRPPDELATPIKRPRAVAAYNVQPTALVKPVVDGRETTYFEWLGAGVYAPDYVSAAIHESEHYIKQLYYGYSDTSIYLRLDLNSERAGALDTFQIRVGVNEADPLRTHARIAGSKLRGLEFWRNDQQLDSARGGLVEVRAAYENIFEIAFPYAALGLTPGETTSFQVSFWHDQLPVQVLPKEGWLSLELTEELVTW